MGKNSTRWNWTADEEMELCDAVWGMYDLLDWNKRHGHRSDVFWSQIAGRLWPAIKVTGDACRKRWEQSKVRYFQQMKEQFEADAMARETADMTQALKPLDDMWSNLEAKCDAIERDLNESTYANTEDIRNTLSILLEDVRRLCNVWDVETVAEESQRDGLD